MSIDTFKANKNIPDSPEHDKTLATFEEYRSICEATDANYRITGIFDPVLYKELLGNPATQFATTNEGKQIPFIVPLKDPYYNAEVIERMTGAKPGDCLFLAVPLSSLETLDISDDVSEKIQGKPVLLEVTNHATDDQIDALSKKFGATVYDFLDERLSDDPEGQKACFSLFGFEASIDPENMQLCAEDGTFATAWKKYKELHAIPDTPTEDSNLTYIYSGEELKDNPELLAHLWRITQHGFGSILGAYHPVSMDVDEEFFFNHITHPNNHISVRYLDGKPACYGTMTQDFAVSDWMRQDVLTGVSTKEKMLFSEVISGEERGAMLSPDVIRTLADVCAMTGAQFTVLFESTNLSEKYVLPIVRRIFTESIANMTADIDRIDTLRYKYLLTN